MHNRYYRVWNRPRQFDLAIFGQLTWFTNVTNYQNKSCIRGETTYHLYFLLYRDFVLYFFLRHSTENKTNGHLGVLSVIKLLFITLDILLFHVWMNVIHFGLIMLELVRRFSVNNPRRLLVYPNNTSRVSEWRWGATCNNYHNTKSHVCSAINTGFIAHNVQGVFVVDDYSDRWLTIIV